MISSSYNDNMYQEMDLYSRQINLQFQAVENFSMKMQMYIYEDKSPRNVGEE